METIIWIILCLVIVNLIFTLRIAIFLPAFAAMVQKNFQAMAGEPPLSASKNGRSLDDSGLVDLEGVYNYDPRFTNPDYGEN